MSDRKQFRSEKTRKNYEKQEKKRAAAARRKALRTKTDSLLLTAKAWLRENRRQAAIIAGAAALVIALAWLGCQYFVGPGGSIPNFFGSLVGVEPDWLVINTAAEGKAPRYHHLADFAMPEGYELAEFTAFDDEKHQDFYIQPIQEGGLVCDAYVSGAKNMKAGEYIPVLLSYGMHKEATEPRQGIIAGKEAHYVCLTFDESDTDGEGMGYRALCIYMDARAGACVSAMVSSDTLPFEELPDEAALLAEAEKILSNLTLME